MCNYRHCGGRGKTFTICNRVCAYYYVAACLLANTCYAQPAFLSASPELRKPQRPSGTPIPYPALKAYAQKAKDYAWAVGGLTAMAQAVSDKNRANLASQRAVGAANVAKEDARIFLVGSPPASGPAPGPSPGPAIVPAPGPAPGPVLAAALQPEVLALESAAKSLQQAQQWEKKAKAIDVDVTGRAYWAARAGAEAEVKKLEMEGDAYFEDMVEMQRRTKFPVEEVDWAPQQAAAADAAGPYIAAGEKSIASMEKSNTDAIKLVESATVLQSKAKDTVYMARQDQAKGDKVNALKKMVQARALAKVAQEKLQRAQNLRKYAEAVRAIAPSYKQAARQAAEHAFSLAGPKVPLPVAELDRVRWGL